MCQTLFTIPSEIGGVSLFGFGWLLGVLALVSPLLMLWSMRRYGWGQETRGMLQAIGMLGVAIALILPLLMTPEGLAIRGFGAMLLLAIGSAVGISVYRARAKGLDPELILSLATWLIVSGIVGARVFYIIEYWHSFQRPTLGETLAAMVNVTQGGIVVYGSLLAGGAALVVFVRKHHLPGLALSDLVAPGVVLGVGLGRLGCFLNGCCYGGTTDVAWAVRFPPGTPAYMDQYQRGQVFLHGLAFKATADDAARLSAVEADSDAARQGLKAGDEIVEINGRVVRNRSDAEFELMKIYGADAPISIRTRGSDRDLSWTIADANSKSLPVHPTQLYSLIDALLLCGLILAYEPYRRRDGELTALVLTIHPISRFLLEIIRIDESAVFNTGMSISQNISIGIFAGGVLLWFYLYAKRPVGCAWRAQPALAA